MLAGLQHCTVLYWLHITKPVATAPSTAMWHLPAPLTGSVPAHGRQHDLAIPGLSWSSRLRELLCPLAQTEAPSHLLPASKAKISLPCVCGRSKSHNCVSEKHYCTPGALSYQGKENGTLTNCLFCSRGKRMIFGNRPPWLQHCPGHYCSRPRRCAGQDPAATTLPKLKEHMDPGHTHCGCAPTLCLQVGMQLKLD